MIRDDRMPKDEALAEDQALAKDEAIANDESIAEDESLPLKRSIALVIARPDRDDGGVAVGADPERHWLLVRRPEEDELPAVWGLPAGSFREGEGVADLVRRIGRDKLGVEVAELRPLNERVVNRTEYRLSMRLHAARVLSGEPRVPQAARDVTQYTDWGWKKPQSLTCGAKQGSLCCALGLELLPGRQR